MKKSKRRTTTTSANLVQYKTMLKQSLIPINRHLAALDKRFVEVDQNFKVVNGKLAAFVGINSLNIDRAINGLEKRHDEKFDAIMKKMDGFLKRTEDNEREIMFLGKQHDNLAKYCNEKIAYPEYGRKL